MSTDPPQVPGQPGQVEAPVADLEEALPKSVLARGLSLLSAFGPTDTELGLAELAARTRLPKPTAHRLLRELVSLGALERSAGGYRLGLALFVMGQRVPRQRSLREAALPYLEDLYEATHENVHLAVPEGRDTLFLEKLTGRRAMPIVSRAGDRLPAYCTATGKVFLAHRSTGPLPSTGMPLLRRTPRTIIAPGLLVQDLERTRARGYAVNREEAEVGVSAVAAPVYDADGVAAAAISVTGDTLRMDFERLGRAVRATARALSQDLARRA